MLWSIVVPVGCGTPATRYTGTATNDGLPASPGALSLTVFSHTDTSFAGYLAIGSPLSGGGQAYGWFPSGGLTVFTVSETGDTIVWKSTSDGIAIGGRYSITGGRFRGQGGAWRARLLQGTALTAKKLTAVAATANAGDVELLLALALIAVAVWAGLRWISTAPSRSLTRERALTREEEQLIGAKGWIAWFLVGQILTVVVMLARIAEVWRPFTDGTWTLGNVVPGLRFLVTIESVAHAAQILLAAIGVYLTVKLRPSVPRYWFAYLVSLFVYGLVDVVGAGHFQQQLTAILGNTQAVRDANASMSSAEQTNLRLMLWACVWVLYWSRSKRVRVTFGYRALESLGKRSRSVASIKSETDTISLGSTYGNTAQPVAIASRDAVKPDAATSPSNAPHTDDVEPVPVQSQSKDGFAFPKRKLKRGLILSLATLICIGIAAWLVLRQPGLRKDDESAPAKNGSVLLPREIASRARRATVQIRAYDTDRNLEGEGTGFFVSSDGVIATNLHLIDGAESLEIETLNGDVYDVVYFVTADARRDIAILKVPADDANHLRLATDSGPDVGESVYVMGNPLGQTGTFSDGLVSARRLVEGVTLLQITAPVSPGSSGGPVMNSFGKVVGITTLMLRGGQNLNYAVPVRYLRPLVTAHETPQRYARNLLPSASAGLAALETPTRERRGRTTPRDGRTIDVIRAQFRTADSLIRSIGGAPVGDIVRGRLDNGHSIQHPANLVAGHEYVIAGYCDEDCSDLDLAIYTPAADMLASDTEYDDYPILRFVAPETGSYPLTVTMASCSVSPCAYGIRLYLLQER